MMMKAEMKWTPNPMQLKKYSWHSICTWVIPRHVTGHTCSAGSGISQAVYRSLEPLALEMPTPQSLPGLTWSNLCNQQTKMSIPSIKGNQGQHSCSYSLKHKNHTTLRFLTPFTKVQTMLTQRHIRMWSQPTPPTSKLVISVFNTDGTGRLQSLLNQIMAPEFRSHHWTAWRYTFNSMRTSSNSTT